MVVTELACLHIKNHLPVTHPSNEALFAKLKAGLEAQAEYADFDASLLSQLEDPSYIYILGGWDSVAQHMDEWIPSFTNQEIMGGLREHVDLVWLQHLDLDPGDPLHGETVEGIPYTDIVVGFARMFIAPGRGNRQRFTTTWAEIKHLLRKFEWPRDAVGAWRIDCELDDDGNRKEEFVVFVGWDSIDESFSLSEDKGNDEVHRLLRENTVGWELKHAKFVFPDI
ncbi:uncharacterized protein BDV17DRAFT_275461 [Aspergillus undulatus]|uniref:uncharacterized protein n=1 Tax=Aspergillus undulatus TaxID=1810928 RepID=UPI003CCD78E9